MRYLGISRPDYFAMDGVSASYLKSIDRGEKKFKPEFTEDSKSFGNLVDAILSQVQDVDTTHPKYKQALRMVERFHKDPFCRQVWEISQKQTVHTDDLKIGYKGLDLSCYGKCLYDFDISDKAGADLKTGSCYDKKSFLKIVDTFDWDMGSAWYMDVSGKTMHSLICLSKIRDIEPLKLTIRKGDEWYKKGQQKYLEALWIEKLFLKQA